MFQYGDYAQPLPRSRNSSSNESGLFDCSGTKPGGRNSGIVARSEDALCASLQQEYADRSFYLDSYAATLPAMHAGVGAGGITGILGRAIAPMLTEVKNR